MFSLTTALVNMRQFLKSHSLMLVSIFFLCVLVLGILYIHQAWWWLLIILPCFLYIIYYLWQQFYLRKKGSKLVEKLFSQQTNKGKHLEHELLKEKMQQAIKKLRRSHLGLQMRGAAAMYALPWFVIIGPPAVGKTTLLRESGLHFFDDENPQFKGFAGTRNCDWWFADEAIFLDTAGRYTVESEDQAEWNVFLKIIKKTRKRLPLNGVILTMSLEELLTFDGNTLQQHVLIFRSRIGELYNELGYKFPVHCIITKLDLLPGFDIVFSDLPLSEREKVLGCNFFCGLSKEKLLAQWKEKQQQLNEKIINLVLAKLSLVNEVDKKWKLLQFIEKFYASRNCLNEFIHLLAKETPYLCEFELRSVFFTSSLQQKIEKTVGTDSLNKQKKQNSNFFIKDIFVKHLIKNNDVLEKTKQNAKKTTLKRYIVMAGSSMVSLVFLMNFYHAYEKNSTRLVDFYTYSMRLVKMQERQADYAEKLQKLVDLYMFYKTEKTNTVVEKLRSSFNHLSAFDNDYRQLIVRYVDEMFKKTITQQLVLALRTDLSSIQALPKSNEVVSARLYENLKLYLQLIGLHPVNDDEIKQQMVGRWNACLNEQEGGNAKYNKNVLFGLLKQYFGFKNNKLKTPMLAYAYDVNLVQKVRDVLLQYDLTRLAYDGYIKQAINANGFVNLEKLLKTKNANYIFSNEPLPNIFTQSAWRQQISKRLNGLAKQLAGGDWVLYQGSKNKVNIEKYSINVIEKKLKRFYLMDYMSAWKRFLLGAQLHPIHKEKTLMRVLQILSGDHNLFEKLIALTQKNINFAKREMGETILINKPYSLKKYSLVMTQLMNDFQQEIVAGDGAKLAMRWVTQLLNNQIKSNPLGEAALHVSQLLNIDSENPALKRASRLLMSPVKETWRMVLKQAQGKIDSNWQQNIVPFYQQYLNNRLPFTTSLSTTEVNDIKLFFQHNDGLFSHFYHENLSTLLTQKKQTLVSKHWLGLGLSFSEQAIKRLIALKTLANLFQQNQGWQINFSLYPLTGKNIKEIMLDSNAEIFHYRNGPQYWHTLTWSLENTNPQLSLSLLDLHDQQHVIFAAHDIWALWRMLIAGNILNQGNGVYRITWKTTNVTGRKQVSLLIKLPLGGQVIENFILHHFQLPYSLFSRNSSKVTLSI